MMADAADEAMMLTRGVDSEAADPAIFPGETRAFLQRIDSLFVRGNVF
jgi:hypothetical protein